MSDLLAGQLARIRATLLSAETGYAVHVGCQGECVASNPLGTTYECHGCDRTVPYDQVVELVAQHKWGDRYARDVAPLLAALDALGVNDA